MNSKTKCLTYRKPQLLLLKLKLLHFSLDKSSLAGKQKPQDHKTEGGCVWAGAGAGEWEPAPPAAAGLTLLQQVQAGAGELQGGQGDAVPRVREALHRQVPADRVHEE